MLSLHLLCVQGGGEEVDLPAGEVYFSSSLVIAVLFLISVFSVLPCIPFLLLFRPFLILSL